MNILLLLAHSIEEHDQLKLLSSLGYDVFSIGGYINPGAPHDPKRPALPEVPYHPELQAVVDALGTPDNLDAAKRYIPDDLIDWADTIIVHHLEHTWLAPQWPRLKASDKRIIWRTVGQSVGGNEAMMAPLHEDGLEIIRYSPKERNIPNYAGEDALIRFYKDPDEWCGWTGHIPAVLNITQGLRQREPFTNWRFWEQATRGLPRVAAGPGSEVIGGVGELSLDGMQELLRGARAYLYTGTQPASYTLGLIEAMMTGVPVVSIGPSWMRIYEPFGPDLFEGHELIEEDGGTDPRWSDDPAKVREWIEFFLDGDEGWAWAETTGEIQRQRAIDLFGKDTIGRQWKAHLGA